MRLSRGAGSACLVAIALSSALGCGRFGFSPVAGADDDARDDDAPGTTLALVAPPTVLPGTMTQLGATEPVTWTVVDGAAAVAVDEVGLFTAPPAAATVVLRATSVRDPSVQATVTIDVTSTMRVSTLEQVDVGAAAGLSSQNHAVYDADHATWWVFYISAAAPSALLARHTKDWLTWSTPTTIEYGTRHGGDGRNLSVADRVLASGHVVHIAESYVDAGARGHVHMRAILGEDSLDGVYVQFITDGGAVDPDGPAVAISPSGVVTDTTGFEQTPQMPPLTPCGDGDVDVFTSSMPDSGALSDPQLLFSETIVWCVSNRVSSRWLYAASDDVLFALYEDGTQDPDPRNILMSIRREATWYPRQPVYTPPPAVFATTTDFALADWSAVPLYGGAWSAPSPTSAPPPPDHLVVARSLSTGAVDVSLVNLVTGATTFVAGPTPTAFPIASGTVLIPYGAGVILLRVAPGSTAFQYSFALASALADPVAVSPWSAWLPLSPSSPVPGIVPASPAALIPRPGLLWHGGIGNQTSFLVGGQLP